MSNYKPMETLQPDERNEIKPKVLFQSTTVILSVSLFLSLLAVLFLGFQNKRLTVVESDLRSQIYDLEKQLFEAKTEADNQPSATTTPNEIVIQEPSKYNADGLFFVYPKNWSRDTNVLYEVRKDRDPNTYRYAVEKNILEVRSNKTELHAGYSNSEWFEKIAGLTEKLIGQRDTIVRYRVGKVNSGESYLIFGQTPSPTFQGEPIDLVIAYIISNETLYELRLSSYETVDAAIDILESILSTLQIG